MAKKNGSAIAVWFSDEERLRLEEASALAGYKHLSTYIKDRTFARADFRSVESTDDMSMRFDVLFSDLAVTKSMLTFLVMVATQDLSSSSRLELIRRLNGAVDQEGVLKSMGELGQAIDQFSKGLV